MQYTFYLECYTQFGQNLYVEIGAQRYAMEYVAHGTWRYVSHKEHRSGKAYRYCIVDSAGGEKREWMRVARYLPQGYANHRVLLYDSYECEPKARVFRSLPFVEVFCNHHVQPELKLSTPGSLLLQVDMPGVETGQVVGLLGDSPRLGAWNGSNLIVLTAVSATLWQLLLNDAVQLQGAEYKLVVYDLQSGTIVRWEDGFNRRMPYVGEGAVVSLTPRQLFDWHGAGVAVPLFALRSSASWGVGDFGDLRRMVDWCASTGMRLIQLLPVNDTMQQGAATESYPYNAISTQALHPMYIDVSEVARDSACAELVHYEQRRLALNSLSTVEYGAVCVLKLECLRALFAIQGEECLKSSEYRQFYDAAKSWLEPYALFCFLRDKYGTAYYEQWPEWSQWCEMEREHVIAEKCVELNFYFFLQYHAHKQLQAARSYAHRCGVVLKGDLPIGISKQSVEAWVSPELFHLDSQAGAPPDAFSVIGQNWGFPTYCWDVMKQCDYAWWKERFIGLQNYFDAIRIDHILGFFRIWSIPQGAIWGLLGHFEPALPYSEEELRDAGLQYNWIRYTKPYITYSHLKELFGAKTDQVVRLFFKASPGDMYLDFCEAYGSQQALQNYFTSHPDADLTTAEQELLLGLQCEVLLLSDGLHGYHPRIHLSDSYSFRALPQEEQQRLLQLHDDYFFRRHEAFWRDSAMSKLPYLTASTEMMVCGEDLGMLPASVSPVLAQLQILSLEIERMPKQQDVCFAMPDSVPYYSVYSTGTHDMSSLRGWWGEHPNLTERYYHEVLGLKGKCPLECTPTVAEAVIRHVLNARSMWVILPIQDYLAMYADAPQMDAHAERINDPSNAHQVWNYRMPLTIDELLGATNFNRNLEELVRMSGR